MRSLLLKESEDDAGPPRASNPNAPEHLLNILLHELQRGDDEPQRAARNLRAFSNQAPDFLEEALPAVRKPERVWRGVCDGANGRGQRSYSAEWRNSSNQAGPQPNDEPLLLGPPGEPWKKITGTV